MRNIKEQKRTIKKNRVMECSNREFTTFIHLLLFIHCEPTTQTIFDQSETELHSVRTYFLTPFCCHPSWLPSSVSGCHNMGIFACFCLFFTGIFACFQQVGWQGVCWQEIYDMLTESLPQVTLSYSPCIHFQLICSNDTQCLWNAVVALHDLPNCLYLKHPNLQRLASFYYHSAV